MSILVHTYLPHFLPPTLATDYGCDLGISLHFCCWKINKYLFQPYYNRSISEINLNIKDAIIVIRGTFRVY